MPRPPKPPEFDPATDAASRAIDALSDEGFEQAARLCRDRYHHWDKVRFIARDRGLDPETLWFMVKFWRMSPRRLLLLEGGEDEFLSFTDHDAILREQMHIDQQLGGRITFDDNTPITENQRDRFVISSLMEEAIASSQLEGASTVHRVAKEMLRENRKPRDRGERMIVNNYHAMHFIREHRRTPMSPEMIVEMQRMLTQDTLERPDECGRLRAAGEPVVVEDQYGELLHRPPDAESLDERLEGICAFANGAQPEDEFIHPFVRACALHFQLAYDHPFCDGNGRTARLLFYWSMLRAGYWLFEFLPISRLIYRSPAKYGKAFLFVETDEFDLTYFLIYKARVLRMARESLRDYLARKRSEATRTRRFLVDLGINDRQRAVLLDATENPTRELTIKEYQASQGISYFTARSDLLGLEEIGLLDRRVVGRTFLFTASDRLLKIERSKE